MEVLAYEDRDQSSTSRSKGAALYDIVLDGSTTNSNGEMVIHMNHLFIGTMYVSSFVLFCFCYLFIFELFFCVADI